MSSASDELKAKITEVEGKIKDLEEQLKHTADAQERINVSGRLTAYINLLATYQASYQTAAATGGGAGTSAVNFDARAAQALFSCFDEVPMLLDRDIITTMLQTPVARAVEDASSNSRYSSDVVWGQLFVTTAPAAPAAPAAPGVMPSTQLVQRYTDVLYTVLSGAAEAVPPAGCNEAAWCTFYGKLLDDVFNLASQLLGLRFKVRRGQVDTSITQEDKM